jgi:hypothetical protein
MRKGRDGISTAVTPSRPLRILRDLCGKMLFSQGSALRSGARVTTESMSAIALPMKRAVIGVPS